MAKSGGLVQAICATSAKVCGRAMVSPAGLRLNRDSELTQPLFGCRWESVIRKESSKGLAKTIHRVDSARDAKLDCICKVAIVGRRALKGTELHRQHV